MTVVAIDGPAGSGKSTLARRLAIALGLPYVNTGTTYRAVASEALRRDIDPADGEALAALASSLRIEVDPSATPPSITVEGADEGADLLSAEVERIVSMVAAHPQVRSVLRKVQRRLAADGGVVEGRDIGTVVFPDADVKVFLHADPDERAARRVLERGGGAERELAEAVARRDALDARVNPFVPAPDAVAVDTSGRTQDEVFDEVLSVVRGAVDR